jgi:signal peptidase II
MRWHGTGDGGSGRPGGQCVRVLLTVAALVYAADVISKAIVVATLTENTPVRVVGSLLQLDYLRNPGAAFSLGADGYTVVFTLIAAAVIVAILRMARTLASRRWAVALGLLLGGALGNLTDRIARSPGPLRGWVVDFIQLPHWPVFNLADSAICCGGALMVLLTVLGVHPDRQAERRPRAGETRADETRAGEAGASETSGGGAGAEVIR